jgi:hypothetical protein
MAFVRDCVRALVKVVSRPAACARCARRTGHGVRLLSGPRGCVCQRCLVEGGEGMPSFVGDAHLVCSYCAWPCSASELRAFGNLRLCTECQRRGLRVFSS